MASGQQQTAKSKKQLLEEKYVGLKDYLSKRSDAIARQLPPGSYSAEQFLTAASVTIRKSITDWSDGLVACNPEGLFLTLMDVASLGLLPSWGVRGECALVPFGDQATLIIGYRGYVRLFLRSGAVRQVTAEAVWHGDEWDRFEDEKGVHFHFRPVVERDEDPDAEKQLRKVRLFYATAHLSKARGGGVQIADVSLAKYLKIRSTVLSKIAKEEKKKLSPHVAWPLEQGVKSAVRQLQKLVPTYETDNAAEVEAKYERDVQGISWEDAERTGQPAPSPTAAFRNALPAYTPRETIEFGDERQAEPIPVEAVRGGAVEARKEGAASPPRRQEAPPHQPKTGEVIDEGPPMVGDPDTEADSLIALIDAAEAAGDLTKLKDLAPAAKALPTDLQQKVLVRYEAAKKALKSKGGAP